jgi:hypothetical protein
MWGSANSFFTAASFRKPSATGADAKNSGFLRLLFSVPPFHLLFVLSHYISWTIGSKITDAKLDATPFGRQSYRTMSNLIYATFSKHHEARKAIVSGHAF